MRSLFFFADDTMAGMKGVDCMKKAETIVEMVCIAVSGVVFFKSIYDIIESIKQCTYNHGYTKGYNHGHDNGYIKGYRNATDLWYEKYKYLNAYWREQYTIDTEYWCKKYEEQFLKNLRES